MNAVDLSIGQRLAIGFGMVLAVLLAVAAGTLFLQHRSATAHAQFVELYAPRAQAAAAVERAILRIAVATRSYLISPGEPQAERVARTVRAVRDALQVLAGIPKDPDGERIFAELRPAVERYATAASTIVQARPIADSGVTEELLAQSREAAVMLVRQFADLQQAKSRTALAAMDASRRSLGTSLLLAFAAVVGILLLFGILTARAIRTPARELTAIAREMQAGNWLPALRFAPDAAASRGARPNPRDELARIALAFGAAAQAIERREQRLRSDAQVAGATSSSLDRASLAEQVLRAMANGAGASAGVAYWRERDGGELRPIASHALAETPETLRIGEGLPGQAAKERRLLVLEDIPPDSPLRLRLGVEAAPPRAIAAVPAILHGEVLGVVALASIRPFDADALSFLKSGGQQLAIGLSNVRAHAEAQRLLAELREAHERVQAQNEELQAQGEELQAQNEEIQAQNEEIQAQSEELQAQNEQLHRHVTDLAVADQRKNHFLGMLSHELRNPLAAIANSIFLLDRGGDRGPMEERGLQVIERQMRYLTRLIDDLLDVTRISHGKLTLQREPLDLVPLVRNGVNDSCAAMEAAGLAVETKLPEGPVLVNGDRTRLAQVLGNLLSNAMKFTPRGGRVRIALEADGGRAALHVSDSGPGIDPSMAERLFQPFSQGDPGISRANGGLGLGLALCRALAELHGGAISMVSEGGTGAHFVVTLPTTDARPATGVTGLAPPASRQARRILLIEDNDDAAETLRMALSLEGHHVEVARSGTEGVEKAHVAAPEIILCDLGIPGLDGYEVARRLRADPKFDATAIVALSGYATAEDRGRTAASGFDDHLAKPVPIDTLFALVSRLERRSAATQA